MKIGIDFDNTLISYDEIFYKIAFSKGLIKENIPKTKVGLRDYFIKNNLEEVFTKLQAEVYGPQIINANIFDGVLDTLTYLSKENSIVIVSHKTIYPYSGPKYKLRDYADKWLKKYQLHTSCINSPISNIFYEDSLLNKTKKIVELDCDLFVDDLPKVLYSLPKNIKKILFNPNKEFIKNNDFSIFDNWGEFPKILENINKL